MTCCIVEPSKPAGGPSFLAGITAKRPARSYSDASDDQYDEEETYAPAPKTTQPAHVKYIQPLPPTHMLY